MIANKRPAFLLLVVLLAALIVGCTLTGPTRPATGGVPVPQPPKDAVNYPPDQVVVAGPAGAVDLAVAELGAQYGLQQVDRLDLGQELTPDCKLLSEQVTGVAACLAADSPWVVDLYTYNQSVTVPKLVQALLRFECLFPSPNYAGGDPWTGAGSPWTGAGSPWTGAGSPWTGAGSPWLGPSGTGATLDLFLKQWALEHIGLTRAGARDVDAAGAEVPVGVFDTSPFPWSTTPGEPVEVRQPFSMTAWYPALAGPWTARLPAGGDALHASHGLFVAGLINVVAPKSDLHLYRVLDDNVQGDLFTLDGALWAFITHVRKEHPAPTGSALPRPAVINLSLGIYPPADWEEQGLPAEVTTLQLFLAYARCQNMVVVAAAGNGREPPAGPPEPQIPASYEFVTGVSGTNYGRRPSCFSNIGDLAAPAGDGAKGCSLCTAKCERLSLIGPVLKPGSLDDILYAYWVGTSFAAPLASGQAALLLGDGLSADDAVRQMGDTAVPLAAATDPDHVTGRGAISIPASLGAVP